MTDQSQSAFGAGSACPDVDTLADYHAGVFDEQTSAQIAAHVASDPRCQEVLAALDATVAQLRSLPPVQMPEHVAARINAALAVEAGREPAPVQQPTLRSVPAPAGSHAPRTAPTTLPPRAEHSERSATSGPASGVIDLGAARERKASRSKMWLAAAAAAVVVGGGVVIATQSGDGSDGVQADQSSQTSAAQDDEANEAPAPGNGAALGFGSPSDVLDQGQIVDGKVSEEVAGEMAEAQKRNQCLAQLPDRPVEAPEAVQQGEHEGDEAYAFVFPTDNPDEVLMIIVKADDCSVVLDQQTGKR